MVKINFISGMSCVGKSFYINQHKADNDIQIDLFDFQQEHRDYVTAEYFSDISYREYSRLLQQFLLILVLDLSYCYNLLLNDIWCRHL